MFLYNMFLPTEIIELIFLLSDATTFTQIRFLDKSFNNRYLSSIYYKKKIKKYLELNLSIFPRYNKVIQDIDFLRWIYPEKNYLFSSIEKNNILKKIK